MYPRQASSTHTEQLGDEIAVYDAARKRVHALNSTAACVWRQCDGATSPAAMAAALRRDLAVPEAEAVVDLALRHLAGAHLLEAPADRPADRQGWTRRALIHRGVAASLLPAIYSIAAPAPAAAQSILPPTFTTIAPAQGTQGATVAVTLTGTNFIAGGTTVTVSGTGVTVTGVTVSSSGTSLTANLAITGTATLGARSVTVTTAAGTSGGQTFTINQPAPGAPTLTAIAPAQGTIGTTVAVTLTGTNFVVGATTVNTVSGTGVTVNNVVVVSGTSLTATFVLDPAAVLGGRAVTVSTSAGTSNALTFTITSPVPPPTLASIAPVQGTLGTTVAVTLLGTGFIVGATTVTVSGGGVTVNNVVAGSTGSLTADFVLDPAAVLGARTVTVTTAAGTSNSVNFTLTAPSVPAPTLTAVSPAQGIPGATVPITLTGTNFIVGATTVNVSATGVTVNSVVVGSSTSLSANFVLDPTAALGARTVTVTTAGGTSGAQTFTVNPPPPTLTGVSPNQGTKGAAATTVAVTLTGTNFVGGATTVNISGGGVTVNSVVVGGATSLTANFVLDPAAATGARTVTVTTPGGTSAGQTFTINPGSATLAFTGSPQIFTVPPGVTTMTVTARGAEGGTGASLSGLGGSVSATLVVGPGDILDVRVGGQGGANGAGAVGGFNGGGAGGVGTFRSGGGGASDIRRGGILLVVAGGGGGGAFANGNGGAGGGTTAGAGADSIFPPSPPKVTGGGGGTALAGGAGGVNPSSPANDGQPGVAGTGGVGGPSSGGGTAGGGGGGGYFGGGGGAGAGSFGSGAGGGGSSFADPAATGVVHTQGDRAGDGVVVINW